MVRIHCATSAVWMLNVHPETVIEQELKGFAGSVVRILEASESNVTSMMLATSGEWALVLHQGSIGWIALVWLEKCQTNQ